MIKQKNTIIGFGDWSKKNSIIKRHPSTPTIKLKTEMRKYATVIEIDEFRTSKLCSCCNSICKNVKGVVINKKNGRKKYQRLHQIVRCIKNECARCWNRDVNASINIMNLLKCKILGKRKPKEFMRCNTLEKGDNHLRCENHHYKVILSKIIDSFHELSI